MNKEYISNGIPYIADDFEVNLKSVVYCMEFPNGKKYIGITTKTLKERIRAHIFEALKSNKDFYKNRAIRKYKKFNVNVLYHGDDINKKEIDFIIKFDTMNYKFGYNLVLGEEKRIVSQKTKDLMSKIKKGIPSPLKGTKSKYPLNEKQKEALIYGRSLKRSQKSIDKLRERSIGNKFAKGVVRSDEYREKLSKLLIGSHGKTVANIDSNDSIIMKFKNCADAGRFYNVAGQCISKAAIHGTISCGYKWKYI